MTSVKGKHYLFDTIGGHSAHKHDQYLLMINNGAITWSHNDENDKQLFTVTTDPIVIESTYIGFALLSFFNAFCPKGEIEGLMKGCLSLLAGVGNCALML